MREIKFRAWDKEKKLMVSVDELCFPVGGVHVYGPGSTEGWSKVNELYKKINKETIELMQFTGLKDINGKEIFEGDIVKRNWSGHYKIGEDEFGSRYREINKQEIIKVCYMWDGFNLYPTQADECEFEVIGNVWQNPELLEAK